MYLLTRTCVHLVFQRSPTLEPSWNPSSPCYNPNSTVEIMCTLWNTPITVSAIEVNFGWARGGFNVSIVGESDVALHNSQSLANWKIVASKYYNKKAS